MNVQSNLPGAGTMQSATITQEPTAVSAWRAITFQTGEYAWVSSARKDDYLCGKGAIVGFDPGGEADTSSCC